MQPTHLVVGHITKPHGTKGEVFVWPLTDRVDDVYAPGQTLLIGDEHGQLDPDGGALTVEGTRDFKRGLLVRFDGLEDRNAVEDLGNRYLLVPITEVPPRDEDEIFYHELLGMRVVTNEGVDVGVVKEVYETEPAHLLEVEGEFNKTHLIPFADRIVKQVDQEARKLVIKPPPGLLDL